VRLPRSAKAVLAESFGHRTRRSPACLLLVSACLERFPHYASLVSWCSAGFSGCRRIMKWDDCARPYEPPYM
jgi:hypothetical protein